MTRLLWAPNNGSPTYTDVPKVMRLPNRIFYGSVPGFRVGHTKLIGYNDQSLITCPKARSCQAGSSQQMHSNVADAPPHQGMFFNEKMQFNLYGFLANTKNTKLLT